MPLMCMHLVDVEKVPLVIQLTDDEKFLWKDMKVRHHTHPQSHSPYTLARTHARTPSLPPACTDAHRLRRHTGSRSRIAKTSSRVASI